MQCSPHDSVYKYEYRIRNLVHLENIAFESRRVNKRVSYRNE